MRQRSQFVVISLVSLLLMTGCSGDAVDSEQQPPESSPTVAATSPSPDPIDSVPTPEPLPLPEIPEDLMPEDTAENAIRAAEYFVDLINYMLSSGDTQRFQEQSVPICEPCESIVKLQRDRKGKGGYLVGNQLAFSVLSADRTKDGFAWVVYGDLETSDGFEVIDGVVTHQIFGEKVEAYRIAVQLVDDAWMLLTFADALEED